MAPAILNIKTMRFFLLLMFCLFVAYGNAFAAKISPQCQATTAGTIKIAVLSPSSPAGFRHTSGIFAACEKFIAKYEDFAGKIYLEEVVYYNEDDGVDKLSALFKSSSAVPKNDRKQTFDLILGPTESGVYVKGLELLGDDSQKGIPVVSSLVVAQAGNVSNGWFFRLNVDVETRSEKIYDYLDRNGFENISVLFADNILGQRSEEAFSSLLSSKQKKNYSAAAYGSKRAEIRPNLETVLEKRPAAIGIFGQRSDIEHITKKIAQMDNGWSQYNPALFTNIDAGELKIDDLLFVSLLAPANRNVVNRPLIDDVYGLAYDSATAVFALLQANQLTSNTADLPLVLRKYLVNYLDGPPDTENAGQYTGMKFHNFTNLAEPFVLTQKNNVFARVDDHNEEGMFVWFTKCEQWLANLMRRFGSTPMWNVILVILTGVILNLIDLTKVYDVPLAYMRSREFRTLIELNVAVALAVYFYMIYLEVLAWDQTWGAVMSVFGYSAFLKTKIFSSEKSKAIGIADFYNRLVRKKHYQIMLSMLNKEGKTINYIAYANTLLYLQKVLYEFYDFTDLEGAKKIKGKIDKELSVVKGLVEKRKVLAKIIHKELPWTLLQGKRLVPVDIKESEIKDKLQDPLVLVSVGAEYCLLFRKTSELKDEVISRIESIDDKEKSALQLQYFDQELKTAFSPRAAFETCLLWRYIQYGFSTKRLIEDKYLPADFEKRIKDPSYVGQLDQERRSSYRTPFDVSVEVVNLAAKGSIKNAELKDLSEGGARLALLHCDALGFKKAMELEVEVPTGKSGKQKVRGKVVYFNKGRDANRVGIQWKNPLTGLVTV